MAKRVPAEERPYRPVEDALVAAVLNPAANGHGTEAPAAPVAPERSIPPAPLGLETLSEPEPEPSPLDLPPVPRAAAQERLDREKRVLLSRSEEREIERLVADMADTLCTPLKVSHVLRATVLLLRHARAPILTEARARGPLKRPQNGEAAALFSFEQELAQLLDRSLRAADPLP